MPFFEGNQEDDVANPNVEESDDHEKAEQINDNHEKSNNDNVVQDGNQEDDVANRNVEESVVQDGNQEDVNCDDEIVIQQPLATSTPMPPKDTTPIACRTRKQMIQHAPPALRTRARKRMVPDGNVGQGTQKKKIKRMRVVATDKVIFKLPGGKILEGKMLLDKPPFCHNHRIKNIDALITDH